MVGIVIGRCAAAGAGFCTAVLRVGVFAPRTGGIAMIAVVRCGISADAARCRSAVLTAAVIAPRTVAHAMRSVVIAAVTAIPAVAFTPVLGGGVFLPRTVAVVVTAGINGFCLCLTTIAAIFPVAVSRASGIIFIVQNPCMASAVRASPRTIRAGTMIFIHISAKIFYIMALVALVVLLMTS